MVNDELLYIYIYVYIYIYIYIYYIECDLGVEHGRRELGGVLFLILLQY